MKVEIWGDVRGTPKSYRIWKGKLSLLPRPDDCLYVDEDRGGLYVRRVDIIAPRDAAEIHVWLNETDDPYPEV